MRAEPWMNEPPPMSRAAARLLADRLENVGDAPTISPPNERQLIVAALRHYGKSE